jgi:tetratricopeptide (TPR) repeat protein
VTIVTYGGGEIALGQGSGFFIGANQLISNRHVFEGAYRADVKAANGETYSVKGILAEARDSDLILLQVDIPLGAIQPLSVITALPQEGERIIVVGSPLGLEQSLSDGLVSAIRESSNGSYIFQITAPLSEGSSGSPVMNLNGEVIGVAVAQLVPGQSLNFAIPGADVAALKPGAIKTLMEWTVGTAREAEEVYSKGLALLWSGDLAAALTFFEQGIHHHPEHGEAWLQVGYCHLHLGRYREAIEAFQKGLQLRPDSAAGYSNLGVAYVRVAQYAEAIVALEQALRIRPSMVEALSNLCHAYSTAGRYQDASQACAEAIRLEPARAAAYSTASRTYCHLGRYQEAIAAAQQAIRLNPEDAVAYTALGLSYRQLGQHLPSSAAIRQATQLEPGYVAEEHNMLGVTLSEQGQYEASVPLFIEAMHIDPRLVAARANLGLSYSHLGRSQEAIEAYQRALQMAPNDAETWYSLGWEYATASRYPEAMEALQKALQLIPTAKIYTNLAFVHMKLGRFQEAIDGLNRALQIQPDFAEAHLNLSLTYLAMGNQEAALREYALVKRLDQQLANRISDLFPK